MSPTIVEVPRNRHRGRRAIIAIAIVIVVLAALFFVVDYFARQYATTYVQKQVASALGLASTAPVSVNLGSGSILLQAASGDINDVTVTVDPLVIDGLSGSATLTAHGVPLSSTTPVKQLEVVVDVPQATIAQAIAKVPSIASFTPRVAIAGQHVRVTGTVSILGFVQHIGVTMHPTVAAGVPGFTITAAQFDGATISIAQLDNYVPGLSTALQASTSLCIANVLPKSFALTGITLRNDALVSTFTGSGVEFNGAALSQKGTCP